jgi:hypothetical protein
LEVQCRQIQQAQLLNQANGYFAGVRSEHGWAILVRKPSGAGSRPANFRIR